MRTEEDEAFDELARRQGSWGGGFPAKRQMTMDKIHAEFYEKYVRYRTASPQPAQEPYDQTALELCKVCGWKTLIPNDGCLNCERTQPAQEPEMQTGIAYQKGFHDGKQAALAGREWNFCERCGKRTADLTVIHTCTPPQEKSND
jgi:hypothetical protein